MSGTSCTDDASVKVPSFQYGIFHRDAIYFIFVGLKMFLAAVIKDEHASNDSFQSDSSFLLSVIGQ